MCERVDALDWSVCRHDQLQRFVARYASGSNVAATLSNDNPAVATECPNHLLVVQARDLHTAISMTSASTETATSSSIGSR